MRYLTIILSLICVIFTVNAAKADKRVAFVVGNGAYKNVPQLPNPPFDARAMASLLRNIGFEVIEGTDLTRDEMTSKLLEFAKKARDADVAVFYYAGHGLALQGAVVMRSGHACSASKQYSQLHGADAKKRMHERARHESMYSVVGPAFCFDKSGFTYLGHSQDNKAALD